MNTSWVSDSVALSHHLKQYLCLHVPATNKRLRWLINSAAEGKRWRRCEHNGREHIRFAAILVEETGLQSTFTRRNGSICYLHLQNDLIG